MHNKLTLISFSYGFILYALILFFKKLETDTMDTLTDFYMDGKEKEFNQAMKIYSFSLDAQRYFARKLKALLFI